MKTISSYVALIILAVILSVCKVDSTFSQQQFPTPIYFSITDVYSSFYNDGLFTHYFIVDTTYVKKTESSLTIEELIVTTNHGDIIFPPEGLKNPIEPVVLGSMKAPNNIEQVGIIKAVVKINGTYYDITEQLTPRKEFSIPIVNLSEQNKTCPPKVVDFVVAEGTFNSFECDDICHTLIVVNGKMANVNHTSNLAYFFEDEKNQGKKIKFFAEVRQDKRYEDESRTSFDCLRIPYITKLIVLPK
jgi:hypothetical protein